MNDSHRILAPRLTADAVSHTAPQIDDLLAVLVDAAGTTKLAALRKIFDEGRSNALECGAHRTVNGGRLRELAASEPTGEDCWVSRCPEKKAIHVPALGCATRIGC